MIKTFLRITLLSLVPAWLLSNVLVVVLMPSLQPVHGELAAIIAERIYPSQAEPIAYRFANVGDSHALAIRWPYRNTQYLNAFYSDRPALDDWQETFKARPWLAAARQWLLPKSRPIQQRREYTLWQPAQHHYKQLVFRHDESTYLDQVLLRDAQNAQVSFTRASAGYLTAPVDLFGGLYLFTNRAPEPQRVDAADAQVFTLNQSNAVASAFLKEMWALNHQYWAVVTWLSLALAGFMVVLPWFVFARLSKHAWVVFIGFGLANAGLLWLLMQQWAWFYPVILPWLSPLLAWLYFLQIKRRDAHIAQLQVHYQMSAKKWLSHLLDEGKPEAAFRYLKEQSISAVNASDLWLLVAEGFERNREFDRALECYQLLHKIKPSQSHYKQKIKQLAGILDGTATVAISQTGGELPVGQVKNLTLGRYQIASELGRGAMGVVYEAEDPKIHRKVAIKVVHLKSLGLDEVDQVKQRFFREAQAAGKLNHPNIVTVYDVGEEHDVAYIAMDLLIGKPMSALVNGLPTDLVRVVSWVAEAADALAYAHEHDVIHRDVKPANMIIEAKSNRLKLTDFGVARIAGVQQTQTGIVLGSPSYMSPEQIRGEKLTGSTDIFSLGVTLYQGLTGELPFAGDTLPALAYGITQTKQESPRNINPEVPISLVRIVNKALQKNPEERYATAADFAASLKKWAQEQQK